MGGAIRRGVCTKYPLTQRRRAGFSGVCPLPFTPRRLPAPARPREGGDPELDSRLRGNERASTLALPSPRARGEGRDEGASPLGAELRRRLQRCRIHRTTQNRGEAPSSSSLRSSTSPRTRGEVNKDPLPARAFACGPPDLSHVKRTGAKRTPRGGWPRCLSSLFPFRQKYKGYGTPEDAGPTSAPWGAALPPEREGAARLPAFHHGSSQGVCGPLVRSGPGFVGRPSKGRGSLRRRPDHFQRRTSHAGRNAGRHDARTARERVASPPAGSASRPTAANASAAASFTGEMIRGHM